MISYDCCEECMQELMFLNPPAFKLWYDFCTAVASFNGELISVDLEADAHPEFVLLEKEGFITSVDFVDRLIVKPKVIQVSPLDFVFCRGEHE